MAVLNAAGGSLCLVVRLAGAGIGFCALSEKSMKIALVAPLIESVPPKLYGGTERVVSFLAEELVAAALFDELDEAARVPRREGAGHVFEFQVRGLDLEPGC